MQHQKASNQVDEMARRASQLAGQQSDFQNRLRQQVGATGDTPRFNGQQPGQSQQQADKLAGEKEQMAEQLKQLEKDMSDAARSMAGAQNPVSNKLRDALSQAEQNEIELNMRRNAEYIRRGYGMSAWVRENSVTKGLNDLRDQLQQAQAAMQDPSQNGKGPGGDKNDIEKALAQVEAMRNRMQQLAQAQQNRAGGQGRNGKQQNGGQLQRGQDGQQPGQQGQPGGQAGQSGQPGQQGQPGQAGQPGGQQGQQPGQGQQGGQSLGQGQAGGQQGQGGQYGPGGLGTPNPGGAYGPYGGGGPVTPHNGYMGDGPVPLDQGYRESLRDLGQMRDFLKEHPEFSGDVQQLMHALNPAYQNDGELTQRLNREVIPSIERLELELRRKLDDKNGDQVRSAGSETIPPGYSGAVADYYRKLSKSK
jgi:hypothetical protein